MSDGPMQAVFNDAIGYNYELGTIRKGLHDARISHQFLTTYDLLVSYYLALSACMGDTMQKKHDGLFTKATTAHDVIKKAILARKRSVDGIHILTLYAWERELRKDEKALGLLTPGKEDPGAAIGTTTY